MILEKIIDYVSDLERFVITYVAITFVIVLVAR